MCKNVLRVGGEVRVLVILGLAAVLFTLSLWVWPASNTDQVNTAVASATDEKPLEVYVPDPSAERRKNIEKWTAEKVPLLSVMYMDTVLLEITPAGEVKLRGEVVGRDDRFYDVLAFLYMEK
jgi:hypothetical protein